ncbi:MAG: hypothetical protein GKS06_11830 [Acidobacteria bacterium]|nr:hypothetical protein [Acidobacteriota bacterium]
MKILAPSLLALVVAAGATAQQPRAVAEAPLRVELEVSEQAGATRWNAAAQLGVPLPRHAPASPAAYRVVDDSGTEIPSDRWVLARWGGPVERTDLPIRWMGVRFRTDLQAGGTRRLSLESTPAVTAADRELALQTADGVLVDTGAIAFRIPSAGTSLLDTLSIDLDGAPGTEAELLGPDHGGGLVAPSSAGTPGRWETAAVRVIENGQFATKIRVDLIPRDGTRGPATIWIRATRDSSVLHLSLDATNTAAEAVSLALPVQTLGDPLELGVRRDYSSAALEGPLPADGTLVVRPDADGWIGTLGTVQAPGLIAWAQMSSLTWSATVASRGDAAINEFRVTGNGVLWTEIGTGTTSEIVFELRRRLAPEGIAAELAAPISALVLPETLWRAEVFGPAPVAAALASAAAAGTLADGALSAVLRYAGSGDASAVASASRHLRAHDPRTGSLIQGLLFADTELLGAVASDAAAIDVTRSVETQAEAALDAWQLTGQRGHLEHARALLRTAIGAAWSANICDEAKTRSAEIARLIRTTGTYVWIRRNLNEIDQAAENAIFGMLGRLQDCVPTGPEWTPAWAFGGALFEDSPEGERWLALGAGAPTGPRLGQ